MTGLGATNTFCRVLGIFSEDVVRHSCNDDRSRYDDLGRPTLRTSPDEREHTLDSKFQNRSDRLVFVGSNRLTDDEGSIFEAHIERLAKAGDTRL